VKSAQPRKNVRTVRTAGAKPSAKRRRVRAVRASGTTDQVQLHWPNKERRLMSNEDGDIWVTPDDFRLAEVRLLTPVLTVGDTAHGLLVRGDALHALKSLSRLEKYKGQVAGKVKLCYIDPPFNTGEDFEHYPDSHASPGWLALLREHLVRIKELLAPEGSVWIHLDDSEQHRARCVLDEVFGAEAFVATIIWQRRTSRDNRKAFSSMHDYIHVYAPIGPVAWKKYRNSLPDEGQFTNLDGDPRGPWRSVPMSAQAGHATVSQFYTVISPVGEHHEPPPGRCWTYTRERFEELVADGRVYWPRSGRGKPRLKHFLSESNGLAPFTIWQAGEVGENADAKKALMIECPGGPAFDTPKPVALLERIVHIASNPGDLVLDCFLGSGTTAVVAQRMGRRWIGVERNVDTVERFVVPRIRTVLAEACSSGQETPTEGFVMLDVAPSFLQVDSSTSVSLAGWATGGALSEAIAAQLGYVIHPDGPFIGHSGRTRLAVIDGLADAEVVSELVAALQNRQLLDLAATQVDHSAVKAVAALGRGHRIRRIPEDIVASYESKAELLDLHGDERHSAIANRAIRLRASADR
jgi:adenine-specific DNA-methyltransferase